MNSVWLYLSVFVSKTFYETCRGNSLPDFDKMWQSGLPSLDTSSALVNIHFRPLHCLEAGENFQNSHYMPHAKVLTTFVGRG